MNRLLAVEALGAVLQQKWEDAKKAFDTSRAGATSGEVKQESKYDTRGIEEAYLAHGLSNAVREAERAIRDLEEAAAKEVKESVQVGSLVGCKRDGETVYFFLSASGGGIEAQVEGVEVTIISPESPLAQKLMGAGEGKRVGPLQITSVG